jgi:hypothetical protein
MKVCKKHTKFLKRGVTYSLVDSGNSCVVCKNKPREQIGEL